MHAREDDATASAEDYRRTMQTLIDADACDAIIAIFVPPLMTSSKDVANAIRDATGADIHSLPISREEMLRALREAEERAKAKGKRGAPAGV